MVICLLMLSTCISFFFVANQAYDISVSALVIVILSLLGGYKKANFQCLIRIRRAISAAEIQMEQLRQPPQGGLNVIDMEEEAEGEEDPPSSSGYNLRNK